MDLFPSRLKLPVTAEARGEFGYALTLARLRFTNRLDQEFARYIADYINVELDTYYGYESGSRVDEGILHKLLHFYRDSDDVCGELHAAYERQYGTVVSIDGRTFTELLKEVHPRLLTENIDVVRLEANKQYANGNLAGAYQWAKIAWDKAQSEEMHNVQVAKLGTTLARFASNKNDHQQAMQVLQVAQDFVSWDSEPQTLANLLLSAQAVKVRALRLEGQPAAMCYIELLQLMRTKSSSPSYALDQDWGWAWYDALRSAITCLCDTFSSEDKRQIKALLKRLHPFAAEVPELAFVYRSTGSRILSVLADPDKALTEVADLNSRKMQSFADECYHARSRILATFRTGPDGQDTAISEADLYARKCGERSLFHKQETFILMAHRLRGYVERQENLN